MNQPLVSSSAIKDLFAHDIHRRIEEVVKVDQTDEQIIRDEIREYVVTDAIRDHFRQVLERYNETPNKPHEGIAVWVSGFFGSGKSSFAKMLGLALSNRNVAGEPAAGLIAQRTGDVRSQVLLKQISEHVPTEAVIFDVSTDRGIRSGNQTLTEIMYRLFLKSLGYAEDLDLAELEITLEHKGQLDAFKDTYRKRFDQEWDENKDLVALSLGEASAVMHDLFPDRYAEPNAWLDAMQDRADITAGKLAERGIELMQRRHPGKSLVFVVDEVGQFVARDVQKMLDLQGVVQSLGRVGQGKVWIVVTSQEKLTELASGLDDRRVELARLMDRFPLQVHLEPSDISEVTSKRVLAKNAQAESSLRDLYTAHSGRLQAHTKLSADIKLPELTAESFMDLYPLLPYQIDLVIQVVSGLRTQGGASKHVGGANRTIIKLAQQLVVHEAHGLSDERVGKLVTIDKIYDLVSANIPSEIRGKITDIAKHVDHALAQPVAKAICLLQYVKSIHRTAENVAAALHPAVDGDSRLAEVKEALAALLKAHQVRLADDGQYRIPTPAEDDWEITRARFAPRQGDIDRIHAEVVSDLWAPAPSHNLMGARTFKGGLVFNGRSVSEADIAFHITLAEAGPDHDKEVAEARSRSQSERQGVFWVAALDTDIARETEEVYRSREILSRQERNARTRDEMALVREERHRLRRHESELQRRLRDALLAGQVYFRGNDRSPSDTVSTVTKAAVQILEHVLPNVFDRFAEGAATVRKQDLDALLTNENLRGLPPVFNDLGLLKSEGGQPVFVTDSGPLKEVFDRIENRTQYGESADGRYLSTVLAGEPFGWDFDVVRLFVVSLVRAGKLKAIGKGTPIEDALSVEARNTFPNNNNFRACSFQPRVVGTSFDDWIEANDAYQKVFGAQIPELQAATVARCIREKVGEAEESVRQTHTLLVRHDLPGADVLQTALDQMRAIRTGDEDGAITGFVAGHKTIRDAIRRANELVQVLTEPNLERLRQARQVVDVVWVFLRSEQDVPEAVAERATSLADLLARETFYRELAAIDQHARALEDEYRRRFVAALKARAEAYTKALERLRAHASWAELDDEQRQRVARSLTSRTATDVADTVGIPFLRSERDACSAHLRKAIQQMTEFVEGNSLVTISAHDYFGAPIKTPEELKAALDAMQRDCEKQLGEGKTVLIQ